MNWKQAIKASDCGAAVRVLLDPGDFNEPNIVLIDGDRAKAFVAEEPAGWKRLPLTTADRHDDWHPATAVDRKAPWRFTSN